MMSLDLKKTLYDVHPSFVELEKTKSMSISDSTLDRLAGKVHALNQEKKQRLRKVLILVIQSKAWLCMLLVQCVHQPLVCQVLSLIFIGQCTKLLYQPSYSHHYIS
jgi:hypothetical protein